jgi:hypothetical protein
MNVNGQRVQFGRLVSERDGLGMPGKLTEHDQVHPG